MSFHAHRSASCSGSLDPTVSYVHLKHVSSITLRRHQFGFDIFVDPIQPGSFLETSGWTPTAQHSATAAQKLSLFHLAGSVLVSLTKTRPSPPRHRCPGCSEEKTGPPPPNMTSQRKWLGASAVCKSFDRP